jgi:endonuclease/exonuclease/phosphatase family metal-dependent hydrolase
VRFDGHSRTILICNLHLGLAGYERTIQLRRLLASDVVRHTHRSTAAIIGGDFNDVWGTLGPRLMRPAGFQPTLATSKTFPAFFPLRPLDHLFFRGGLRLDHSFVSRTATAQEASDHLPLVADFVLE